MNNLKIVGFNDASTRLTEVKVENHALKVIGSKDTEMNTSLNNIETTLSSHSGYIDEIETHHQTTHTKLDTLNGSLTDGTQKSLLVGANDINGGTPHRHLTVDANGRLLVNPLMTTTNTHHTTTHTKLDTLNGSLTDGTQKSLVFGANDIAGNTPRCLTVDGNGRLMTYPYEHPSSWTNTHLQTNHTHLQTIIANTNVSRTNGILLNSVSLPFGTTHITAINASASKHIRVFGTTVGSMDFFLMGSQDDTNYFELKNIFPSTSGDYSEYLENCPPYLKVKAGVSTETITLHYSLLN